MKKVRRVGRLAGQSENARLEEALLIERRRVATARSAGWYANAYTRLDGFAINQKEST